MAITRGATVTAWIDSATPIDTSFAHTVNTGTSLLVVALGSEGDLTLDSVYWNTTEAMTLIGSVVTSSAGGDCRVWVYGRVNPTTGAHNVSFTVTGAGDNAWGVATNYLGTVSSSVADATNLLDSEDNGNNASQTVAMSAATTLGSTLFIAGTFYGGDGDPATESNDGGFSAVTASSATGTSTTTDTSYYVGDKIGGGTGGVISPTIDWTSTISDECVGVFIEILSGSPTLAPAAGAATLTGQAPTLRYGFGRQPTVGALSLSGGTPSKEVTPGGSAGVTGLSLLMGVLLQPASASPTKTPDAGATSLEGYAPTVRRTLRANVTTGELAATGQAPALRHTHTDVPDVGALALTGQAPTVRQTFVRAPAVGALALAGAAPALAYNYRLSPAVAGLALSSDAVSRLVSQAKVPTTGDMALTGQAPELHYSLRLTPANGGLALTGLAPLPVFAYVLPGTVGSVALTGFAPTLRRTTVLSPAAGSLAAGGQTPTLAYGYRALPGLAALALSGQAPTVRIAPRFQPAVASLSVNGQSVTVPRAGNYYPDAAGLGLDGQAPALRFGYVLKPAVGALAATGQAPAKALRTVVAPGVAALAVTGQTPSLPAGKLVTPDAGAGVLAGQAPTVRVAYARAPAAGSAVLTGQAPTRSVRLVRSPAAAATALSGYAPTVRIAYVRAPAAGALAVTGQAVTIPGVGAGGSAGGVGLTLLLGQLLYAERGGSTSNTGLTLLFGSLLARATYQFIPYVGGLGITGQPVGAPRVVYLKGFDELRAQSATLSGSALRIIAGSKRLLPGAGALGLAGQQPVVYRTEKVYRYPAAGQVGLTGQAPQVLRNLTVAAGSGSLGLSTFTVTLEGPRRFTVTVGSLGLSGQTPKHLESPFLQPEPGALSIGGRTPTVQVRLQLAAGLGELGLGGETPTPRLGPIFKPAAGALDVAGQAPFWQGVKQWAVSASLNGRVASIAVSTTRVLPASGTLLGVSASLAGSSGVRIVHASASLQAQRAYFEPPIKGYFDIALEARAALLLARITIKRYTPPRPARPARVNRYTVRLQPNKRTRIKRPNTRKPLR